MAFMHTSTAVCNHAHTVLVVVECNLFTLKYDMH